MSLRTASKLLSFWHATWSWWPNMCAACISLHSVGLRRGDWIVCQHYKTGWWCRGQTSVTKKWQQERKLSELFSDSLWKNNKATLDRSHGEIPKQLRGRCFNSLWLWNADFGSTVNSEKNKLRMSLQNHIDHHGCFQAQHCFMALDLNMHSYFSWLLKYEDSAMAVGFTIILSLNLISSTEREGMSVFPQVRQEAKTASKMCLNSTVKKLSK